MQCRLLDPNPDQICSQRPTCDRQELPSVSLAVSRSCGHIDVQSRAAWVRATKGSSEERPRPSAPSPNPACPTLPSLLLALGAPQGPHPAWCSNEAGLWVNPGLRGTLSSESSRRDVVSPEPTEFLQLGFGGRRGEFRIRWCLVLLLCTYCPLLPDLPVHPAPAHIHPTHFSPCTYTLNTHRNPMCTYTPHTLPYILHKFTHTQTPHPTSHILHTVYTSHTHPQTNPQ